MQKRIFGQVGKLKDGKAEEYTRLHSHVWAEVLDMIEKCNIKNYSIFLHGLYVFSYYEYEGKDYEEDMKRMGEDPATKRWWRHTHPCFESYALSLQGEFFTDMEQVFYFNPDTVH